METDVRILHYYWELFWRRPLVWLVPSILVFAVGASIVLSKPKSYTAEALIVVRSDKISSTLVQSTVTSERLHFIEQRVLARDNLLALIEKFNLFPGLRGARSKSSLAEILRSQITIRPVASEPSEQYVNRSVFSIAFEGETSELSAAVTSEIVMLIVNENRRARFLQAADATHFLEREVAALTAELRAFDVKWDKFIRANENALPSRLSAHLQEIQASQEELAEVEATSADLASEIRILNAELALGMPLADATVRSRREQLSALGTQLATRLPVLSEAHPEIKSLRSRIASLEADIEQAVPQDVLAQTTTVVDLGPELGLIAEKIKSAEQRQAALAERRGRLNASLASLREIVALMPSVEAEMTGLQRQKEATQRSLDDMADKLNMARIGERLEVDQQADQIQVLQPAEAPEHPTGPSRTKILILILGMAGAAGLATLYVSDTMDKTIRGTFDVSRALEGRPLVVLPYWSSGYFRGGRSTIGSIVAGVAILMAALVMTA